MRLPFVSRRAHNRAVRIAVAAVWHLVEQADDRTTAEHAARLDAEHALTDTRNQLARETTKRERLEAATPQTPAGHYELRLVRALRAVATLRADAAIQRRVIRRLSTQLLDATGHNAEPLLPAARTALGLDQETQK